MQIEACKSTFETPIRIILGRTTSMDLPLFVDKKQDERSKSEKDTVLGTKLFYSHQKFPGKDFCTWIKNDCRFGFWQG